MTPKTLIVAVVMAFIASHSFAADETAGAGFRIEPQKISDGVYVLAHTELPGLLPDANSVVIINDDEVVVVDTNLTLESARASIAELRKLTNKPVRWVINIHWHDDHVTGNQVYQEAFPQAKFIAHEETREALTRESADNRQHMVEGAPQAVQQMKDGMAKGQSLSGKKISALERESYEGDFARVARYMDDTSKLRRVLPTLTLNDCLMLYSGSRKIEIRYLGRGHSRGELVIYLPQEKVLVAGDLVSPTEPLIGDKSCIKDWIRTLERLQELPADTIVPGHGPVMRDQSKVTLLHDLLVSMKQQTDSLVANGASLEQAFKAVDLEGYRRSIAGDDALLNALFSFYVRRPGIAKAFKEATDAARPDQQP